MAQKKKRETLDEFLARASDFSQPPRENYVEVDPEEASRRAKAFEALKAKENAINEIKAAETKVSKKEDGTPQYEGGALTVFGVAPETPEPPAPPAPTEAPAQIDNSERAPKVIPENLIPKDEPPAAEEARTETKEKGSSSFPWDRALVGATPLLVGLLTGNQLEGIQVAGDHLVRDEGDLYKRERDLNQRLEEIRAKRDLAASDTTGKRRYTFGNIEIEDPTAPGGVRTIKAAQDSFTGKMFYPNGEEIPGKIIRSGYAAGPEEFRSRVDYRKKSAIEKADILGEGKVKNPATDLYGVFRNGQFIPFEGQDTRGLNPKDERDAKTLRDEFRQNPIVKRVLPVASVSQQLQDLLNSGRPVSQRAAATALARMSGEVGNLSEMEQEIYTGSPSINARVNRWLNLQATDEVLRPHEVEDLRSIANFYANASRELLEGAVTHTREIGIHDYGLPEGTVNRITAPIAEPLREQLIKGEEKAKDSRAVVEYGGKTYISRSPGKIPVLLKGEVKFINPNDWAKAKKDGAEKLK